MKVTLNRQKLGVEDLEIGLGTVSQTRGGETVIITKIGLESLLATANVVVNTLPAGSDATVEISGAALIFGIPVGDTGESLTMTSVVDNLDGTFTWHFSNSTSFTTPNLIGLPGKSTYEVAVDVGFVGTEADWLLYLEATSRVGNAIGNTVGNTIGNTPAHIWDGTSLSFSTNDAKDEFGSSVDLVGPAGNGIASVALTNTVGGTKTYTITFTDTSTTTFDVVNGTNGADGQDVDHISKTAGTGAAGTTDTYTVWLDAGETISAGTFNVYNGADGLGSGDMVKTIYDPTNINSSVFDTDNHISGTTNKVYTATEQTKLSGIAEGADVTSANETSHADVLVDGDFTTAGIMKTDGAGNYSIDTNTYLTSETSHPADALVAQDITNIGNLSGTNTGDQDLSGYSLTSHHHTGIYEPADATILKDVDIGSTVQAYSANTTAAGNTFNGANQLVQLNGTGKLPALDGSLLTGLSSGVTDHTLLTNIGTRTHAQLESDIAVKQATLVSGTNIKTVGGSSILGSGNIVTVDSTKLPLTGGTMTGAVTSFRETKIAMGANDINLASGNLFTKTISAATTLTMSNKPASGQVISFILELTNAGSAVITWFSGVKWAGGTAPTLTTAGKDILGCYSHDGGLTWNVLVLGKDVK